MAYVDLTSTFKTRRKITFQDSDKLGENDKFNHFDAAVDFLFFQTAVPIGFTKITTQNDKVIRVVSGAGGGSGGSAALSAAITLAHSHTVDSHDHSHPAHTHDLEFSTSGSGALDTSKKVASGASDGDVMILSTIAGASAGRHIKSRTQSDGGGTAGTATPGTDSKLSNVSLAFIDMIIGTKDAGTYTDHSATFTNKKKLTFTQMNDLAQNDLFDRIEADTVMVFGQASTPAGWTKQTTQNDKALRIVSGSGGGSGGSVLISAGITLAHDHTVDNHNHSMDHSHVLDFDVIADIDLTQGRIGFRVGFVGIGLRASGSSSVREVDNDTEVLSINTDNNNPGTDSQLTTITLAYFDVVQGKKDAAGSFTDLTSSFAYKDLVVASDLDAFSINDKFNLFVSTTSMIFFESVAPTGWTKSTAQNDKALRVVSGSGGGAAGSHLISSTIVLAHSHTVTSHTHPISNHIHDLTNSNPLSSRTVGTVGTTDSDNQLMYDIIGGAITVRLHQQATKSQGSGTSGSAAPGMDSKLSNVSLAFIDTILCDKD